MSYTAYANYIIWFADPAEHAAAVAANGQGYGHCPFAASSTFGLPWPPVGGGNMYTGTKGMYTLSYSIGLDPGPEIFHPTASGLFFSSFVDFLDVPGQPSNPAGSVGADLHLVWWGYLILAPTENPITTVPPVTPIPPRRWLSSWDVLNNLQGEGQSSSGNLVSSREASRTMDGKGYAIRGGNAGAGTYGLKVTTLMGGIAPKSSWERFYLRINALGTNSLALWQSRSDNGGLVNAGAIIKINTSGNIEIYSNNSVNVETLLGTSANPLTLGKWLKIDILLKYAEAHPVHDGRVRIFINGVATMDVNDTTAFGLNEHDYHGASRLGQMSVAETLWDVDIDDWMCADIPNVGGLESLDSLDWLTGTHNKAVNIVSGTSVDWIRIGGIQSLNGYFDVNDYVITITDFKSLTSQAVIQVLTDAVDEPFSPGQWFGVISFMGQVHGYNAVGTITGQLGYSVNGGAFVNKAVSESNTLLWQTQGYSPVGNTFPAVIAPLSLKKTKSIGASEEHVFYMTAILEYVGAWGLEDSVDAQDLSNNTHVLLHNARYPDTPWAYLFAGNPDAPCYAIGGTYVGNDDEQIISLPAPCHFLWIRGLNASTLGIRWFAAGQGGNEGSHSNIDPFGVTRVYTDPDTFETNVVITGNDINSNKLGDTYQYIAFCDPGSRFNYCGAYVGNINVTTKAIPLFEPTFLPEGGFIQRGAAGLSGSNLSLGWKGPGDTATGGHLTAGTVKANWGSFAEGVLTVGVDNMLATTGEFNFSLWRMLDPSGYCMVQITSYTGDGNVLRIITLPQVTGKYPLFAMVIPHGGAGEGYFRDPSCVGNLSNKLSDVSSSTTTSIVGGDIDSIFVGVNINGLATVYEVFVIMGGSSAWGNGIVYPPPIIAPPPYIIPPFIPNDDIVMQGGMDFDGDAGLLAVKNLSGIYTLVPNKVYDTVYTGIGATTMDTEIPTPLFKTGYIGG